MGILKCLICGAEIKSRHSDINKSGRLTENTVENIKCCPFCGVSNKYINNVDKPYFDEIEVIDDETYVILDHAMKLEVFNSDFYKKAEEMATEENIKEMFKDLSRVEFTHAVIHKKAGGFEKIPTLTEIDYSRLNCDELLVKEAINRERHAVAYYEKYLHKIRDVKLKEVLLALSEVEREHINLEMKKLK
jgi:rubrerythrin